MRRVRRQIEHKQTSMLPTYQPLFDPLSRMNPRTVQHHHRLFEQAPRQRFELLSDKIGIDAGGCGRPAALIASADQPKTVQMIAPLRQYIDRFTGELPAIRDISLTAYSTLVAIQQVDLAVPGQAFQDGQSIQSVRIDL